MKKILLFSLVTTLTLMGVACNRSTENPDDANTSSSSEATISSTPDTTTEGQETVASSPSNPSPPPAENGTITNVTQGDLMCYVDILNPEGKNIPGVGATFEVCENADTFLNQNSRFIYTTETVNDCESSEPCGKTRKEQLVSQVVVIGENWQTMDNGEWTVTLGRWESWDGVNNSGDVTYYGCDRDGNCLYLEEGKVICRDGACSVGWSNGNYNYVVSTPITEDNMDVESTLTVTENGKILMEAKGFKTISSSN
jgi:hypothetical protein